MNWRIRAATVAHGRFALRQEANQWLRALKLWPDGAEVAGQPPIRRYAALVSAMDLYGAIDHERAAALAADCLALVPSSHRSRPQSCSSALATSITSPETPAWVRPPASCPDDLRGCPSLRWSCPRRRRAGLRAARNWSLPRCRGRRRARPRGQRAARGSSVVPHHVVHRRRSTPNVVTPAPRSHAPVKPPLWSSLALTPGRGSVSPRTTPISCSSSPATWTRSSRPGNGVSTPPRPGAWTPPR